METACQTDFRATYMDTLLPERRLSGNGNENYTQVTDDGREEHELTPGKACQTHPSYVLAEWQIKKPEILDREPWCVFAGDPTKAQLFVIDLRGTSQNGFNAHKETLFSHLVHSFQGANSGKVAHFILSGPYATKGILSDEGDTGGYANTVNAANGLINRYQMKKVLFLSYSRGCLRARKIAEDNPSTECYAVMEDGTLGGMPYSCATAYGYKSIYPQNMKMLINLVCNLKIPVFNSHFFSPVWSE